MRAEIHSRTPVLDFVFHAPYVPFADTRVCECCTKRLYPSTRICWLCESNVIIEIYDIDSTIFSRSPCVGRTLSWVHVIANACPSNALQAVDSQLSSERQMTSTEAKTFPFEPTSSNSILMRAYMWLLQQHQAAVVKPIPGSTA